MLLNPQQDLPAPKLCWVIVIAAGRESELFLLGFSVLFIKAVEIKERIKKESRFTLGARLCFTALNYFMLLMFMPI